MPQTTIDRLNAAEFTVTVVLEPQDYRQRADTELKRIAKSAKIKGFRPGKVPASFLRQTYGRGAMAEAIGKSVDEAINQVIKDEKLEVFGQIQPVAEPDMTKVSPDLNETLTFVYEGGLVPRVESVDTSALKQISRYTVALSDAEADEKLNQATKRFTDYIERDTVETEEDFATLVVSDAEQDAKYYGDAAAAHSAEPTVGNDAKDDADADTAEHQHADDASATAPGDGAEEVEAEEVDDENTVAGKPKDPRQRYFLRPADLIEESRYKLVDKARGTEVILALADIREDARERFDKVIEADGTTTFTIAKVDRENAPELKPETFRQIFGEDTDVTTAEEARAEFGRRFAENSQSNLDDFTLEQVIDALEANNEVPVPAKAIKVRLELARAEELEAAEKEGRAPEYDHELTEADRHGLGRRLKWMAFRNSLLERYSIDVAHEDVDAAIEREYNKQFSGMGIDPNMFRDRFFDTFKKNLVQNREKMFELTDEILTAKLLARLEEEGVLGERQHLSEAAFSETVERYNKRVGEQLDVLRAQPIG